MMRFVLVFLFCFCFLFENKLARYVVRKKGKDGMNCDTLSSPVLLAHLVFWEPRTQGM